jgi:hypothetical protein
MTRVIHRTSYLTTRANTCAASGYPCHGCWRWLAQPPTLRARCACVAPSERVALLGSGVRARRGWPLLALTPANLALVRANKGQSRPHTDPLPHYNKTRSAAIFGCFGLIIRSSPGKASKLTTQVRFPSPAQSAEAQFRDCFRPGLRASWRGGIGAPPSIKRDCPGRARQRDTGQVEQHHSGDALILVSG